MKAGEWILRSRRVVTPSGTRPADVLIRKEVIAELLAYDGPESEGVILDAEDLAVLPGWSPSTEEASKATMGDGSMRRLAIPGQGGVTTLIDLPPRPDREAANKSSSFDRIAAAEGKIRVDCGLVVPLGHGRADRIDSWIESGFLGVEAFLHDGVTDSGSTSTESDLRAAMPILAGLGRPLLVELRRIAQRAGPPAESERFATALPEREFEAMRLLIRLCRETRCKVHLIHPSASEALPMIAEARAEGLPITVETCPSHLAFTPARIVDGVPTFPLEEHQPERDGRDRLWEGLLAGLIDGIGPDLHQPFPGKSAAGESRLAHLAISPLRLLLPSVWAEARHRGLTLDHLGRWLATRTAGLMGLSTRKGSIAAGMDADFVVFDPDAPTLDDTESFGGRDHPLPLNGRMLAGQVEATILRGNLIYQNGQFFEHPKGTVVLRLAETQPIPGTKTR